MPTDVYDEALNLAANIQDRYLRAVTYAKIGYYMYRAKKKRYKDAFKYSLSAVSAIDNPAMTAKALMEIATYIHGVNSGTAKKVFQQAQEAISLFPQPLRDDLTVELSRRLLEVGLKDDALFYASDIEDSVKRNDVLLKILGAYLSEGNMRKARIIIENIEEEPWRSIAAVEAVKEHLKREEFGSAIRVLKEMKSEYWIGEAMKEVAVYLKSSEVPKATYEKFVDIALSLSSKTGSDVLKSLLIGLGSQGELEFVMEITSRLSPGQREEIFEGIVSTSADRPEILGKLVDLLSGEEFERISAFTMDKLLSGSTQGSFSSVIKDIGEKTTEDSVLVKVATYLSKLGDFDVAWDFASRVRGHYLRSLAFGSIAVAKLKVGDIDGAIDAALEVKDPMWGSWLLSEILTKILELQTEGQINEDIEERAESQRALWGKG
ncbi:hypothetical protein [Thermococcus sp.]|uniref:hypothetical protein n=1 Tax=Thermococcus sp. TaxID=35749 RepID=UPI0026081758|nr:hypothetical protein [Thermococcus sp.]